MFVPQKFEKKCEGKKINNKSEVKGKKRAEVNKNRFKISKLFLDVTSNSPYFNSSM